MAEGGGVSFYLLIKHLSGGQRDQAGQTLPALYGLLRWLPVPVFSLGFNKHLRGDER